MKTIRINKQRLKQVNKRCSQRDQEVNNSKCQTVEAEYWLHSVINAIQDGITVMDTNYNILLQNKATRWLNDGKEITGQPCYKVHYGRNEPCEICHTVEAMATGQLVKKNQPFQQEGLSGKSFEVYAYPIIDEKGTTTGVVEYLRDITELKKREEALQHSESRYESILDATNTGVWEYDSYLQMDRLSNTFFTYLGYDPADHTDIEGLTDSSFFKNLLHPEDKDQAMYTFNQYLTAGSPGIYENSFRIRKKDGTWLWMMSRGKTLRDKEGKPSHITLGTMTDITEQVRCEKQIDSINNIGLLANSTLELDEVLGSILESTTRLVNTTVGMIFIKDPHTGLFVWGASQGLSDNFVEEFKRKPIRPGEGLTGRIGKTGEAIYIPADSSNDDRINRSVVQKEDLNSFLGVPIFAGDEIIGVMNILTRPPMQLSDHDLNIISIVSGQVGLAIRNAQLYQQQKEAMAALKKSEEKFRQISENIGEVFWLNSHDHKEMIYVNPAYEKIWGKSCQSLYENPRSFMEDIYPEDQAEVYEEYDKYMKTGRFHREYRIIRPDETVRWVKAQSFPVEDDEGKVIRHTGIAVDITQRKQIEEKLKKNEEHLRFVSENTSDGIILFENDSITYASQAYGRMLGYESEAVVGLTKNEIVEIIHPEDRNTVMAIIQEARDKKRPEATYTFRARAANGQYVWREDKARFIYDSDGVNRHSVVVARNITERKIAEKELLEYANQLELKNIDLLQAKEKIEAANEAKTQFLANMSHELRTPLNGLMGMLQLLQTTPLNEDQQEYIQIALGGSQSLTRVVGDILNYTNLEKRTQKIIEEPFELEELLQEVVGLHQAAAVHKGFLLSVYQENNLPEQVMGDRLKLKQILGNLVGNAIKFTEKGAVQLSVKRENEEVTGPRMKICFQVKDTGVGIPPEKMEYIFQRFSQVDESHTREYGGLGLGLAVAREQAAILRGSLTAESTLGQGSIFSLTCELGFVQEPKPEIDPVEAGKVYYTQTRFYNTKVLVVDDDYASGLMAQLHLLKMGCDVETAADGQTAMEKVTAKEYHLVFMDCQMPVMDGYEATRGIREMETTYGRHTPIIAMTAKVLPGDQEKCLAAGMDGFLAKPLEREQLEEMVRKFGGRPGNEPVTPTT